MSRQFAIVAGSGGVPAATGPSRAVDTQFGEPSGPLHELGFGATTVLMLARHGDRHTIAPHAINYLANMQALRDAGTTDVIALNTVGVISDVAAPGEVAVPDDLIDYTWGRSHTIHGTGSVVHIEFDAPFSADLRSALLDAAAHAGVRCHAGGVYAVTQGPRLETPAEIDRLERDGADYVGMTAMPEAAIARELGMGYACLALVVNRAAGRGSESIHAELEASSSSARRAATGVLRSFFEAGAFSL